MPKSSNWDVYGNWELFDKLFHPELKHVHPSDKPKVMRGVIPTNVIFDEHLLMQDNNQKENNNAQSAR